MGQLALGVYSQYSCLKIQCYVPTATVALFFCCKAVRGRDWILTSQLAASRARCERAGRTATP